MCYSEPVKLSAQSEIVVVLVAFSGPGLAIALNLVLYSSSPPLFCMWLALYSPWCSSVSAVVEAVEAVEAVS